MHIVLVSQEYPPGKHGGIGAQCYNKAHGLAELGHSITVLAHSTDRAPDESVLGEVRVLRIPGYDAQLSLYTEPARWLTYSIQVAKRLAELHQTHPINLVEFAEWGAESYMFSINRCAENHIPCAIQLHGPLVMFTHTMGWPAIDSEFFRIGTHMEKTCLRLADAIYSSSQCSIDWCEKHYGICGKSVPVLHTGVDCDVFQPGSDPKPSRATILFVGKLVDNKGVVELAQAAATLLDEFPLLQLLIIGEGELAVKQKLMAIREGAATPDFLQLLGFVPRKELPQRFQQAHVFAAPSLYEGGPGFVYLEAMSCGLPVIACAGSGASEVIRDGETGFLVPPKNVEALTETLRRLLRDQNLRDEIGHRARNYVLAQANSGDCLKALSNFYQQVVDRCAERASVHQ